MQHGRARQPLMPDSEVKRCRTRWMFLVHQHWIALNQRRQSAKIVPLDRDGESGGTAAESVDPEPVPDEYIIRSEGIGLVRLLPQVRFS